MIPFEVTLHTDGSSSLWGRKKAAVKCSHLELLQPYKNELWGELRVYFDMLTWSISTDGLIYTDNLFEKELQKALTIKGLAGHDVVYSEQGMQGKNYVSFDVGHKFVKSWLQNFPKESS